MDNTNLKDINEHIGSRIKKARTLRGASPAKIAAAIGIESQQVRKYEKEGWRISAARLYQIANLLDMPPSFFFEGFFSEKEQPDSQLSKEQRMFLRYYDALPRKSRKEVLKLLRIMGKKDE